MEALTDAVGLRMIGFSPGMFDVVDSQVELIVMSFRFSTILCPSVSQDTDQAHALFCKEGQHSIVEQIRTRNRRLGRIELGRSPLGVGIDEGLLIDAANALDGADIEGVLGTQIAWMSRFNLAMGYIIVLLLLQGTDLCFGQNLTRFGDMPLQG